MFPACIAAQRGETPLDGEILFAGLRPVVESDGNSRDPRGAWAENRIGRQIAVVDPSSQMGSRVRVGRHVLGFGSLARRDFEHKRGCHSTDVRL